MAKRWYYKDENGNKVPVPQYKINADDYYTKVMSDSRYYEKSATNTLLDEKVSKSDIVQSKGTSETSVMSQKAVSDAVAVEETRAREAEENLVGKVTDLEGKIVGVDVKVADLSIAFKSKIGGITSTGARGGSSNFTNYYIRNNNYSKVSAFVGAQKNSDYLSIAFYNSDTIMTDDYAYQSSYIGGVSFNGVQEQTTYEAEVPNGCVIIVVSCRTQLFPNPTASLFELQGGLERQMPNKVDKVNGKGLSTNDFTDKDKSALYGIENYDDVSVANGAGAVGTWAYTYKPFKEGQRIRIIMFTPTGLTLPEGATLSQTCIFMAYQITNGQYKSNLLYLQGYDYPIRQGFIKEGVITIEGGETEYIRMYAKCAITEKFGFAIQAIEDNAVNKCYAPSLMIPKFNALSFDSVYTHGRVGVHTFNFLHFSDIHKNEVELKRIKDFSELYKPYLCDVINTGDSVAGLGTEDFSWYAENGSKFLYAIGNHDSATSHSSGGWTGLGKQATYEKFIAPFIADWGVVGSSGNNYYYKDYVSSRNYGGVQTWVKLRLIVLDCMFYDEAQNTWLENTLADARTNGFDVMIAIHTSPASADTIPCTYTSINGSIQPSGWASYSTGNAVEVVKNFINNGGKFICWLGGHVHRDMMGKISADNRQLVALIETCSNNAMDGFDRPYIEGEFEYADAFNIIGIDTYRHLLKIFKVGYEYDGAMRRKGTFVYDYSNSKVIFNG